MTLRNRLIAAFLASTPAARATVWITTSLLDRSLRYATTGELDQPVPTLAELTAKQFYQRERDALKQDALAAGDARRPTWRRTRRSGLSEIRSFWESGEAERFTVSGTSGERVDYMRRGWSGRQAGVEITAGTWAASAWNSCPPGSRNAPPRGRD